MKMKELFIVAAKRTSIGGFLGSLSEKTAVDLGAIAIRETYESVRLNPNVISSVVMDVFNVSSFVMLFYCFVCYCIIILLQNFKT